MNIKPEQLSGFFSLYSFDDDEDLSVVRLKKTYKEGGSYTLYFCGKVLPKKEAMAHFLRYIGAA